MEGKGDGWLVFAAIVLGIAGIMRIFDAIWAFRYHGVLPSNLENAILRPQLEDLRMGLSRRGHRLDPVRGRSLGAARSSADGSGSLPGRSWPSARSGGCPTTRSGHSRTSSSASWSSTGWPSTAAAKSRCSRCNAECMRPPGVCRGAASRDWAPDRWSLSRATKWIDGAQTRSLRAGPGCGSLSTVQRCDHRGNSAKVSA